MSSLLKSYEEERYPYAPEYDRPTETAFQTALSRFRNRLTETESQEFEATTFIDVQKTVADIQLEHEKVKSMRNMRRLVGFLEGMDQFGKVVDTFLNVHPFVAFVWGPMKFLLLAAKNHTDSFEILLDAYRQIGERLPLFRQFETIFEDNPDMKEALALIYTDIIEFHMRAIRFFSGKAWEKIFRSMWKNFNTRFSGILDNLRRHRELIESRAQLLHLQESKEHFQEYRRNFQEYRRDMSKLRQDLESRVEEENRKKYVQVMEWLSDIQNGKDQNGNDHESFCRIREEYPGTGLWILRHQHVPTWKEAEPPVSSILWLNGIPGAGKTILASIIIEECKKDSSALTSYFYCSYVAPRNTAIAIFKGLLSQLVAQHRNLVPYCHDKFLTSGELSLNSANLARQLLEVFCLMVPKQYIIIDGLDECEIPERREVIGFFMSIVAQCDEQRPGKLRVLFVSQEYADIKNSLSTDKVVAKVVKLGPADNQEDIKEYVTTWGDKIQRQFELDDKDVEFIKRLTCMRAQGMFLYAKLVMPNLHSQPNRETLREEIQSKFPEDLNEAYERIMTRIERNTSPKQWLIVRKLLGWMVCALRPLKWIEIQAAVSIDVENGTINFNEKKLREHIHDICGSLVQILSGDRVELVHHTAKLYIASSRYKHIRISNVECSLAALCLQYLSFDCFDSNAEDEDLCAYMSQGHFVFQDYAIAKWFHHFRAMLNGGDDLFRHPAGGSDQDLKQELETQTALEDIDQALLEFTERYGEELSEEKPVDGAAEQCKAFQGSDLYDRVLQIWSHILQHQRKSFTAKNDVSIKSLGEALVRNRKFLEELTPAHMTKELEEFYGEKRFKCTKINCHYFHEGFKDGKDRDKHVAKHDRPYQCPSADCFGADCGFASNKELEKHMRSVHPELGEQGETFTAPVGPVSKSNWPCERCGKRFTRNFHLKNHLKSHDGLRPHACGECGRAFTRMYDMKRHEKIHERRKGMR